MDSKIMDECEFWYAIGAAAGKTGYSEYLMNKRIEYHYLSWPDLWDEFIGRKPSKSQ